MSSTTADLEQTSARVGYGWYVAIVLTACYTLSFVDSKIPFILIQAIKKDLGLSDTELGIIAGPAFSLIYAISGVPISRLSDRSERKFVISAAVVVWSVFTSLGGLAGGFLPFMLSRTGVALGEAALSPAAHSLFADYFPERQRAGVIAFYSCGIALGAFIAMSLGGYLSDHIGWRLTLASVGGVGLAMSALVAATVREPARERSAGHLSEGSFAALFKDPAMRNTILGGTILGVANGSMTAWVPAYIMRTFHLSASATGASFGVISGVLAIVGTLGGGLIAARLSQKDRRYGFRLLAAAFVLATIAKLISLSLASYGGFLVFTSLAGLLVLFYPGPTFATVQSLAAPQARSFASAVILFFINGVGIAGGAFLTGWLSDELRPQFGPDSLRWAMGILSLMSAWAAVHYWVAARHLGRLNRTY